MAAETWSVGLSNRLRSNATIGGSPWLEPSGSPSTVGFDIVVLSDSWREVRLWPGTEPEERLADVSEWWNVRRWPRFSCRSRKPAASGGRGGTNQSSGASRAVAPWVRLRRRECRVQGGPVATAAPGALGAVTEAGASGAGSGRNGSTGGSPMRKPSTRQTASRVCSGRASFGCCQCSWSNRFSRRRISSMMLLKLPR